MSHPKKKVVRFGILDFHADVLGLIIKLAETPTSVTEEEEERLGEYSSPRGNMYLVSKRFYRKAKRLTTDITFCQKDAQKIKIQGVSKPLEWCDALESVSFKEGVRASKNCIELLKKPQKLKKLSIHVPVTLSFVQEVALKCKNITHLYLMNDRYDDDMIKCLLTLTKLVELEVNCTYVMNKAFSNLHNIKSLEQLTLKGCANLTDGIIRKISCIPSITLLTILDAPKLTMESYYPLKYNKKLKHLHISHIPPQGVEVLQSILGKNLVIETEEESPSFMGKLFNNFMKGGTVEDLFFGI